MYVFATGLELPEKTRNEELENIENYVDAYRNISQTERIVETWMMRQAERCQNERLKNGQNGLSKNYGNFSIGEISMMRTLINHQGI